MGLEWLWFARRPPPQGDKGGIRGLRRGPYRFLMRAMDPLPPADVPPEPAPAPAPTPATLEPTEGTPPENVSDGQAVTEPAPHSPEGSGDVPELDPRTKALTQARDAMTDAWPWPLLRELYTTEPDILVEGLIQAGDQVLLSAAPKTGKSFLALELALRLAVGAGSFISPRWRIKAPRRVLYISLEMPAGALAARLPAHEALCAADPVRYGENLFFVFPSDEEAHGTLLKHAGYLRQMIDLVRPEFVIFDTLIQLHESDENDNIMMGRVMRAIRQLCRTTNSKSGERIAHLVLHHNRKALAGERGYGGISSARGAGSIHSEVDLALVLNSSARDPSKATMGVSSRSVDAPPLIHLERRKMPSFHYLEEVSDPDAMPVDEGLLARAHAAAREAFQKAMGEAGISWPAPRSVTGRDLEILIADLMFKALASEGKGRTPGGVIKLIREKDGQIMPGQIRKAWTRLQSLHIIVKVRGRHECIANEKAKDDWLARLWPQGVRPPGAAKKSRAEGR